MLGENDTVLQACRIMIDDDQDVAVWTATRDFDAEVLGRCVRTALQKLDGRWAFELHQFLANGGNGSVLYRLNRDLKGSMPLTMGDASGPFGHGLLLSTLVSSEARVQLGVSMLTAFAVSISQGDDPNRLCLDDLGKRIRELQLPVA